MTATTISSPDDPLLNEFCAQLAELAAELDHTSNWPARQLELCGRYGVFRWFLPLEWGGLGWCEADIIRGYLRLSAACLTTTFIITQRSGACRRITISDNEAIKAELLSNLADGTTFATVGISHLTTSRRHLAKPVLSAELQDDFLVLNGYSPWVTGGSHAETIVLGATCDDGRQLLVALPTDLPGVTVPPPPRLVGLTASHTGQVRLEGVRVACDRVLAGPVEDVMAGGSGGNTGGLQTSALAIGLARAALDYLQGEANARSNLASPAETLENEWQQIRRDLFALADGGQPCTSEQIRQRSNSLVLRATQAAMAAAKGTGYLVGHPAGRWCREALFFLVWSCPQPVVQANLCELAGIQS